MVRNEEIPEMGAFSRAVAEAIKALAADRGISGSAIGRYLGRAQSYASLRVNGRKAWTLDELDRLATLLGVTVEEIMAAARSRR